jgi:antitoxin component of RelBE/YafQ-DinJ toxin-antitoxin module
MMEQGNYVTVEFQVDSQLLSDAEAVLAAQGLTVEDALVLFYRWCAYCPAEAAATIKQWAEAESVVAGV